MKLVNRSIALAVVAAFVSACSGGGGSSPGPSPTGRGVVPTATPTGVAVPTPTSTAVNQAAFTCPSSDTVAAKTVAARAMGLTDALGRPVNPGRRSAAATPGRIAVTYDLTALGAQRTALALRETGFGASLVHESDYPKLGIATRVLQVAPAQTATVLAQLRRESGVRSASAVGLRLTKQTVSAPYFTNDPYFTGFTTTIAPSAGATLPPATYKTPPYEENASVPGQWNEHAIHLEDAFAYSQPSNGSGITNQSALGSASVKLAIIDVGEDTSSPELNSKIVYQKCFITNTSNNVQSTSNFTTDEDGHGTDVAGLAAGATNNSIGFASPGGATVLYAYRVQATPDDNCTSDTTTDEQCSTDTADIASAIDDAVSHGVNVISISLGGGTCTNGTDPDPAEGNAIANAIASNVIVVAAAGNDGSQGLEAPACDTGVIAAGATSLADGQPNGTGGSSGSATSPTEYVASYSDYGSPGAAAKSASAWGIVAPGGDPQNDNDPDDLHWIEDIWTSTPYDQNFEGECLSDYPQEAMPGPGITVDCRTLIAGTSMAAPTVAGSAALIVAVNGTYANPAKMKTLLCTTADDISDPKEGCGRLNVYRAMAVALGDPTPP